MKRNIHKKVLILVLGAGLATFLVLGIFSYFGKNVVQRDMAEMSVELGEKSASYTEDLVVGQLKYTFGELAEAKAQFIDRELSVTCEDATILANAMTDIMSHPENYSPKTLPDPRTDPIRNAELYRIYAPSIRDHVTPEIQNELELAANINGILTEILKGYEGINATAFVGGEKGWYMCARLVVDKNGNTDFLNPIYFSHERIYDYDPRKRPWYIAAKLAGAPVISDLYHTIEADGYQQIGASAPFYDAQGNLIGVAGIDNSNSDLYEQINEFTASKKSVNFVLNEFGEVIFSTQATGTLAVKTSEATNKIVSKAGTRDLRTSSEKTLAAAVKRMVAGEQDVVPIKLNDENFYIAFAPMTNTNWSFGMLIPAEEVLKATAGTQDYFFNQVTKLQDRMRQEYSYINNLVIVIPTFLLIILFIMSTNLSRRFVKPIHELTDGVREISMELSKDVQEISGDYLNKKLDIHTGDEIEELANGFNAMTDELKNYMANLTKETADKERLATELDVATEIQDGMLPKDFPAREDFELFATTTPAKEVGGDFYDFYFLDEKHLAITVADVSGKGIPAALFMVISKTVLNNFAASFYKQNGLAPVVAAANEQLCANNEAMMFVTAFIGVLDLDTGEFIFVNAGHNPPVIYHAEENHCDFLDVKKNFVLGPMDEIPFVEQKVSLKRGDLLFLYTDGVTEALNVADEEYLPDRLINFMNSTDCKTDLKTLLKNIRGDLSEHVGEAEQSDDITMFALRFNGKS
ncbi:MAG: SpoIIE family protein phosphatase [Selenomonadaceae bacterium]|nr:SpoIIE family protein phosphatase [Selenomonadaceae bacterium]